MSLMKRLRSETREQHEAIERTPLAKGLLAGTLTRHLYGRQLAAYFVVHDSLEHAVYDNKDHRVQALAQVCPRRSLWIESDLAALGARWEDLVPSLSSSRVIGAIGRDQGASLVGRLYVMEGSSLGALFLLPRLRETLGLLSDECRYYSGLGPKTMEQFRSFGAEVDASFTSPAEQEAAIEGARSMFREVQAMFEEIQPVPSVSRASVPCGATL